MKKKKHDDVLNIEHHSRGTSVIDVTTRRDRYKQLYYVIHYGTRNKKGKWNNQFMLISEKDIHILPVLLRKSTMFSCTVPNPSFTSAKDLWVSHKGVNSA